MGVSWFKFGNVTSTAFGVKVERRPNYPVAERVVEFIHVDGRNGDYIRDTGAYSNVTMTYSIYFTDDTKSFQEQSRAIAMWLNGSSGYKRLEDSYDPDVFRMAVMSKYTEYENYFDTHGKVDVEFTCKPQRFLKSGDDPVGTYWGGRYMIPNDYMPCYPLIEVHGAGTIHYGTANIIVGTNPIGTMFDTETMYSYWGNISNPQAQSFGGFVTAVANEVKECRITKWNPYADDELYFSYRDGDVGLKRIITYADALSVTASNYTITKAANSHTVVFTASSNVSISNMVSVTDILISNCENRNDIVQWNSPLPPVPEGGLEFTTDGFTSVTVYPRWWVL